MVMMRVKKQNLKFCTRKFSFCLLTKDETTEFDTNAFHVLMDPAACRVCNSNKNYVCEHCCLIHVFNP